MSKPFISQRNGSLSGQYYTPQRMSVKAAGLNGYSDPDNKYGLSPKPAPGWSRRSLVRVPPPRKMMTKSYSVNELGRQRGKHVSFAI